MDKFLLSWKGSHKLGIATMAMLLISFLSTNSLNAQTRSCGCSNDVVFQFPDDDCQLALSVSALGAGNCGDDTRIIVNDIDPSNGNIVDCAGRFEYLILDDNDDPVCWNFVIIEDKSGPEVTNVIYPEGSVFTCTYVDDFVNNPATINPLNDYYIGEVQFQDNCASCGCIIDRKFYDEITYPDCQQNPSDWYAIMKRVWTATDCEGNQTVYEQFYYFQRPSLESFSDLEDVTVQTCSPESLSPDDFDVGYPYIVSRFGDTLTLDQVDCNYGVSVSDNRFEVCGDGSYKLERTIRVLDWCNGSSTAYGTYIIKVGDFEGPEFTDNGFNITGNPLTYLINNIDRDDFLEFHEDGRLPTISTDGSDDCSASFFLELSNLERLFGFKLEDCGIDDINVQIYSYGPRFISGIPVGSDEWRTTNYPMINGRASGVPVGLHALVITASDDCKNNSTGVIPFKVKDLTPPQMQCDDKLNVSVSTGNPFVPGLGAYARVDAEDVNEGSKDNCGLDRLLVRRSVADLAACEESFIALGYDYNGDGRIDANDYIDTNFNGERDSSEFAWEFEDGVWFTPWQEYVEFFCCDVDQNVTIELRGYDNAMDPLKRMAMPNFNTCWLDLVIEDDIDPVLTPLPDEMISCDDPIFDLLEDGVYTEADDAAVLEQIRDRFGSPMATSTTCGNLVLEEEITRKLDKNCKKGIIEREIRLSKTTDNKGTQTTSIVQEIMVVIKHDYYICFPPDVTANCDTSDTAVQGVTYESEACDLFAVFTEDERFDVDPLNPDNGCFKIFRTYRVINWCEHDGESPPVIVGRDWDGDYNTNPRFPDGDDQPGDEGICVIVKRDFKDDKPDTVYYDRDTNPYNDIPGNDLSVSPDDQGYWWRVISGSTDPEDPDYYDGPFDNNFSGTITAGEETVWRNDQNDNGSYDDDDYSFGSIGYWQYEQHIKVEDFEDPVITVIAAQDTFCSVSNIDCAADVTYEVTATDDCAATLSYAVFLDVGNTGNQLINVTNQLSNGVFNGRYPLGTHRLIFQVSDICGNTAREEVIFTVIDCLAPTPICSPSLVVNLSSVNDDRIAAVEIWATDFSQNSPVGDCTGQGDSLVSVGNGVFRPEVTKYSINRVGEPYHPDSAGLTVTCLDAGQTIPVEVHAIDGAGNHGFCRAFVEVQDNNNLCPAGAATGEVAGAISTEQTAKVQDVEVRLSGPVSMMYMTDAEGKFHFASLQTGYDYTVEPSKNTDPRNGVSIVDLIQIKKYLLGYETMDSPYRMIAADVNGSGDVSVRDLLEVQKLILNKVSSFEGNTSWRFIDADHRFSDSENPWNTPFPEAININNFRGDEMATDFMAVKIGDTNGDAFVKTRSNKAPLTVNTQEQALIEGQEYTIYMDANLNDIYGLQFTLGLDPRMAAIKDVHTALLSDEHLGVFANQGMITAAWYQLEKSTDLQNSTLFGITFVAKADAQLSEILSINSRMTEEQAVSDLEDAPRDIELAVLESGNKAAQEGFRLYDNTPNPFKAQTMIAFDLPEAANATLTIQDINGRIIQVRDQEFVKGYNQILVNGEELPSAGIYFYTVKSGSFSATKRFVYLR